MWTARQRAALITILCLMLGYFVVRYAFNPTFVSDPQPVEASRASELADRIDPNVADADTLAALPTLGEKRAKMIVDYRQRYHQMLPNGGEPFQRAEDLMRIRGIGSATVEQLRPFLKFSTTAPSTAPTTQSDD